MTVFFLTFPWRAEVDRPKAGREGVILQAWSLRLHPTPLAALATLPLQGRV